ncbi:MAG: hypothetical protein JNL63_09170 [Bacteroidia bacterium]|nr:hypothetical protein [Bacteroidia bacterium]
MSHLLEFIKENRNVFIISLFSLVTGIAVNELNLFAIKKMNPHNNEVNNASIYYNQTVFSIDNEYYITPAENFLKGKGLRRDPPIGNGSYFRRTPGYSLFYLSFRCFADIPLALQFLKFIQLSLFTISIYCIYFITYCFNRNKIVALVVAMLYGFSPFFSSYCYYTITEGLSPFLMIFYLFFLIKGYFEIVQKKRLFFYCIASFFIGVGIMTRPIVGIAAILLPVFLIKEFYVDKNKFKLVKEVVLIGLIPLLMISAWTFRNYRLTGEIVPLERVYDPETLDRTKPEYEGMLSFVKCWGGGGEINLYHQPMYYAAIKGDTSNIYVNNMMKIFPEYIVSEVGYARLFNIVKKQQYAFSLQKEYYDKSIPMPSEYLPVQIEVKTEYEKIVAEYKKNHFFRYWFVSPFAYFKAMVLHSNTSNLFILQEQFRDRVILNFYRYLLLVFHLIIYLTLFLNIFIIKDHFEKAIFVMLPLLFILFFCVFHREVEQRYMLPVLPFMISGLQYPLQFLCNLPRFRLSSMKAK